MPPQKISLCKNDLFFDEANESDLFMAGMLALAGEYLDIVPCGIHIFSNLLPYKKKANSEREPL